MVSQILIVMIAAIAVTIFAERGDHPQHDAVGGTTARRRGLAARQLDDEVPREAIGSMDLQEAMMANWEPGRFSD